MGFSRCCPAPWQTWNPLPAKKDERDMPQMKGLHTCTHMHACAHMYVCAHTHAHPEAMCGWGGGGPDAWVPHVWGMHAHTRWKSALLGTRYLEPGCQCGWDLPSLLVCWCLQSVVAPGGCGVPLPPNIESAGRIRGLLIKHCNSVVFKSTVTLECHKKCSKLQHYKMSMEHLYT